MALRVKVMLTEPIWRTIGAREIEVTLADAVATVGAVLDELSRLHPQFGAEIYGGIDEAHHNYAVFVNDEVVELQRRDEFDVKDGDEIFILLPIAGGRSKRRVRRLSAGYVTRRSNPWLF